jgi:PTH1 family peptidyl-tRNA hydrolase
MKLIVGLGNPGADYARQRHNVGFMALEAIADQAGGVSWRKKFQGQLADVKLDGVRCVLLKPQTFMNESGRSIQEAARFYKIEASDIVVIHDEVDLAPGKVRVKTGGGVAGHNGLKSVAAHLGPDFRRVRIGVGHPGHKEKVPGYVLHDFSKSDLSWLEPLLDDIAKAAPLLVRDDDANFMNQIARGQSGAKPANAESKKPARRKSNAPAKPDSEQAAAGEGALTHMLRRLLGSGGR